MRMRMRVGIIRSKRGRGAGAATMGPRAHPRRGGGRHLRRVACMVSPVGYMCRLGVGVYDRRSGWERGAEWSMIEEWTRGITRLPGEVSTREKVPSRACTL